MPTITTPFGQYPNAFVKLDFFTSSLQLLQLKFLLPRYTEIYFTADISDYTGNSMVGCGTASSFLKTKFQEIKYLEKQYNSES